MMLGLSTTRLNPKPHFPIPSIRSRPSLSKLPHRDHLHLHLHLHPQIRTRPTTLVLPLATKNDNELRKDPSQREENDKERRGLGFNGGDDDNDDAGKENRRSILSGIRWGDLVLSPDPDNILAVGLTGLLTWASVQVLWQLLFISLAILAAAVKYSLIAALLIFILITLL